MALPPEPDPEGRAPAYGFSKLFTELKITLACLLGGPIAGFILLQKNFLELREYDKARKTLVFVIAAILLYYPLLYWLTYRYYGMDFPAYAKLIPPVLVEGALILYQRARLSEFLRGGAVRESLFASTKYNLAGLVLEAAFFVAAQNLLPNMRGDKVRQGAGRHELFFQGMDRKEAQDLASTLEALGHLKGPRQVYLKAVKDDGQLTLLFPADRRNWSDLEAIAYHSLLLDDLERLGVPEAQGCFFRDAYGLQDTACFRKDAVGLLDPIRNRRVEDKQEVLAKVRAEIDFFRALFDEAHRKRKTWVNYSRVPTLFIFASNGIATVNPGQLPEALAEAYGSRENAVLGVRILAYSFQGLQWPQGDSAFRQYVEALDLVKANLEKVADHWKLSPASEGTEGP